MQPGDKIGCAHGDDDGERARLALIYDGPGEYHFHWSGEKDMYVTHDEAVAALQHLLDTLVALGESDE